MKSDVSFADAQLLRVSATMQETSIEVARAKLDLQTLMERVRTAGVWQRAVDARVLARAPDAAPAAPAPELAAFDEAVTYLADTSDGVISYGAAQHHVSAQSFQRQAIRLLRIIELGEDLDALDLSLTPGVGQAVSGIALGTQTSPAGGDMTATSNVFALASLLAVSPRVPGSIDATVALNGGLATLTNLQNLSLRNDTSRPWWSQLIQSLTQ